MTKRHINTFSGGIDRDTSVNKYDNTHYYDAENIRPISNNTFTSGAISNVDGLLEKADLEAVEWIIPQWSTSDNATLSNITIYKVLTIREKIVLFADFDVTIPDFLTSEPASGIISMDLVEEGFTNYTLVRYLPASLGGSLGFFNFNKELSAVGRYESSSNIKVYWANGIDPLRVLNIVDGETPLLTFSNLLDHVPDVNLNGTFNLEVVSGGSYTSGVVQYAYQLYNPQGTITTISPVSNPVLLSSISENDIGGSDIGVDTNKSVQVSISDLDTRYSRVRILALFYEELFGEPQVNVIYEGINNVDISIIDSNRPIDTLTYEEFLTFNNTTYIPNSLETKNNILFSANLKESSFGSSILEDPSDSNYWDSRAYSFPENSDTTSIYNVAFESSINVTTSNWNTVPYDADATPVLLGYRPGGNFRSTSSSSYNRRYKPNSSVFGGEGPNVKFGFSLVSSKIDNYGNYRGYDLTTYKQNISGLQPNEIYRIGIVFYNKKGQVSFVRWVQDIRVPFPEEIGNTPFVSESAANNATEAFNIVLNVSIKEGKEPWLLDDSIKAWQVVRVKRNFEDREQVYNGLLLPTDKFGSEEFYRPQSNANSVDNTTYNLGQPLNTTDTTSGSTSDLYELICPELLFNDRGLDFDGVMIVNRAYEYISEVVYDASKYHVFLNAKAKESVPWPEQVSASPIISYKKVSPVIYDDDGLTIINTLTDTIAYRNESKHNTYPNGQDAANIGIGGTKYIVHSGVISIPVAWSSASNYRAINVDIVKDTEKTRYGGVTYQSRLLNEYIPYGQINSTEHLTDQTPLEDFNGDTYIKMFSYLRNIFQYDYPQNWDLDDGLQEIITFPMYTSINLDYRNDKLLDYIFKGDTVALDNDAKIKTMAVQETVNFGIEYQPEYYNEDVGDLYTYNSVYSKENTAKKFYPKPFDFVEEEFIDTKVLASEVKTNGEYIDSWSLLKPANFIEVDPSYGSITDIKRFKNQLYCFQEKAISLLAVNDRSLINDGSGIQLALGTGGVLERYDYITTTTGLQRKGALVDSKQALYFIDEYNKELWMLQGANSQELSRIKGFSSKINSLIPSTKILAGFDPNFNEIYFSFDNETWVLNEILGSVIGKFSVNPSNYFNLKGKFYSITNNILSENNNPNSKLGDKSYITLLINPNSNIINSFDNLDFRTETDSTTKETVDRIIYQNSYIDPITKVTKLNDPNKTVSYLARAFRTQVPQTQDGNRFVDSYLLVTFEFDNIDNLNFKLHDVISYYREAKI